LAPEVSERLRKHWWGRIGNGRPRTYPQYHDFSAPRDKLAARRDKPVTCEHCGRVAKRKARQQRFCSARCAMCERSRRYRGGTAVRALKTQEWPMMAHRSVTLTAIPIVLAEALHATLALTPSSEGQKTAQREIATALQTALDARRQRLIISQSQVNLLKWSCLFMQALCALVAIAMVHSDNRLASGIAMGIFATGVAASMLVILAHDRPFTGEISIKPDPLLQVMPE
jgi:endogenous inhibitor of DNA gyrase (YacG/DUF329 family)